MTYDYVNETNINIFFNVIAEKVEEVGWYTRVPCAGYILIFLKVMV